MPSLPDALRQRVFEEARHRCEYCQTSRRVTGIPLVIDHILPRSLGGTNERDNLAASCYRCNEFKGDRTHAFDHLTGDFVPLFNPRQDRWQDHFAWANGGTHIVGLTSVGRATVMALRLNNETVVEARALWVSRDWHPPQD